jgi:hypothetical protein
MPLTVAQQTLLNDLTETLLSETKHTKRGRRATAITSVMTSVEAVIEQIKTGQVSQYNRKHQKFIEGFLNPNTIPDLIYMPLLTYKEVRNYLLEAVKTG